MGSNICMNGGCRVTTSPEWKSGWALKSGQFATLCYICGSAYENLVFCEKFHLEESGWRECKYCRKRIHCGCIVSRYLHHYLESGGVGCLRCVHDLGTQFTRTNQITCDMPNGIGKSTATTNPQPSLVEHRVNVDCVEKRTTMEEDQPKHSPLSQKSEPNSSRGRHIKQENTLLTCNSPAQQSLSFSSDAPLGAPNSLLPSFDKVFDGEKDRAVKPSQQGKMRSHILPKPTKSGFTIGSEAKKGAVSQMRVAIPPTEGPGYNQLLPRYWPKISEEELQQLSGDLNSTIKPLFEKVLSASDAGRMGRLVLPKACAEAYFPPISQSEGLPIRIQDVKGKEWTFQFRFWTNNNSRMYVLEGVAPCLQNMQLQAGDTVLFSQINPGGKLVMGFRKATDCLDVQDPQSFSLPNRDLCGETSISGVNDNPHAQTDEFGWKKYEEHGGMRTKCSFKRPMLMPMKKSRNIGSKSKRLLIHSEDATEMRITWEEAQELLRAPPGAKPTIVMVENHEFEEYDEPPVFGKRTIFIAKESGEQEQRVQCDCCSKWRSLPVDVLVPPKWTCADNTWGSTRCPCSSLNEMKSKKRESCSRDNKAFKKHKTTEMKNVPESEPSGLDALATAAVLEDSAGGPSSEATTKHPRHRPGCTCIVCIQPPSGKGKHKAACTCIACMTVKRRFRTLMMKKRKREEETSQGKDPVPVPVPVPVRQKDEPVPDDPPGPPLTPLLNNTEVAETSRIDLDLNCNPKCEEDGLLDNGPCLVSKPVSQSVRYLPDAKTENKGDEG